MTKYEYRAAASVVAVSDTKPFFELKHAQSAEVRVKRLIVTGLNLTAATMVAVSCVKNSAASTGGTSTSPTAVPMDKQAPTSTVTMKNFSAAPTAGAAVGNVGLQIVAAAAAATPTPHDPIVFDFGDGMRLEGAEAVTLLFPTAPGSATTLGVTAVWTEEA